MSVGGEASGSGSVHGAGRGAGWNDRIVTSVAPAGEKQRSGHQGSRAELPVRCRVGVLGSRRDLILALLRGERTALQPVAAAVLRPVHPDQLAATEADGSRGGGELGEAPVRALDVGELETQDGDRPELRSTTRPDWSFGMSTNPAVPRWHSAAVSGRTSAEAVIGVTHARSSVAAATGATRRNWFICSSR